MLPKTYTPENHTITLSQIDPDAAFIVRELKERGHQAYIVGGCVRDLLAECRPKDFDISTSALPEQIKDIFKRRCLLIGRRFRLAHIRFGKKIFEVSTFRSGENDCDSLIVRDNTWGSAEEDVLRRDFTMNGLFYDPENNQIIDYVNGVQDIEKRVIHSIGDPLLRFKQDPVRMIRALKFQARFGFTIENACGDALIKCKEDLLKASPVRVLEEIYRMLESGSSFPFFQLLDKHGFLPLLYPLYRGEKGEKAKQGLFTNLRIIDLFIQQGSMQKWSRPVLMACLVFPFLEEKIESQYLLQGKEPALSDTINLCQELVEEFCQTSFPKLSKRHKGSLNFLLSTQFRLTPYGKKCIIRSSLLRNYDFKYSLQFLKIRSLIDDNLFDTYFEWKIKRMESFLDEPGEPVPQYPKRRYGKRTTRSSHR